MSKKPRLGRSLRDLLELPLPEMEVRQTSREGMGQLMNRHIGPEDGRLYSQIAVWRGCRTV